MVINKIITLFFLCILLFIPNQEASYFTIAGLIILFSLFLLPVFVENVQEDIWHKNPVTIFFILFLVVSAVSTFFSIDRGRSVVQLSLFVSYFVIFTGIRSIFSSGKVKELFAFTFLLFSLFLSLISLYNTLVLKYVNLMGEGVSFMWIYHGHNHLSALLIFALPLSFYFLWKNWKNAFFRSVLLLVTCCLLLALSFTLARASIISLLLAMFVALGLFIKRASILRIVLGINIVLIVFFVLLRIFVVNDNLVIGKTPISFDRGAARTIYWQQAIDNFRQKKIIGSGLNTFRIVSLENSRKAKYSSYYAHNFFLQMLSDAGIFGFLTGLGLILMVLWNAIKTIISKSLAGAPENLLFAALFTGMLTSSFNTLFDFDWQLPVVFLVFWLFAGLFPKEGLGISIIEFMDNFIDRVLALFFFVLSFPLWVILYLLVKLDSSGPFLFRQKRMGKNGQTFIFYKIRTMVKNAESLKAKYLHLNEVGGPVFKIKNDPRYTKMGRFLSHAGLDEMPQLLNVLKGEMSLVGPRPLPLDEARKVPEKYQGRFAVLPGMTSSWVVKGSHKLGFKRWMELDLEDIRNNSLSHDLQIILLTVALVLGKITKKLWHSHLARFRD